MNKVVRSNLFETNSSSIHAIVINPEAELKVPDTHVINFDVGQFGWPLRSYTSIEHRAAYLWTAILTTCQKSYRSQREHDYYTDGARDWAEYIEEAIQNKFQGDVKCYFNWPNRSDGFFYIDHVDELSGWLEFLRTDSEMLLKYLLGSDSVVRTGNDNDNNERPDRSCPEGWYIYEK